MTPYGTSDYWRITLALCLGSFLVFACLYIPQPLMPMLATEFAITELQSSYSLTLATLVLSLSLLIYGPLSDSVGRRGLIIASLLGLVVITLALSLVTSYSQLLVLRAVQGFFIAGLPAIAVAYMADELEPSAMLHSVGFYIAANSLGGICGRLFSGVIAEHYGWQSAFLFMGTMGIVIWLILLVGLPRSRNFSPQRFRPEVIITDITAHLSNARLLPVFLLGGINFMIFVNQFSFLTFVLEAAPYHLSAQFLGMLFLVYLAGTVGSALSGRLNQRIGQITCMLLGTVIVMLGSAITLFAALPLIILGLLANSFGFFLAHSSASSWVSRNATHAKATASSIYLVFYYLGASAGGVYLNPFWQWHQWPGVVLGSVMILLLSCVLVILLRKRDAPMRAFKAAEQ